MTYDHRYNLALVAGKPPSVRQNEEWTPGDDVVLDMPALDAHRMKGRVVRWEDWLPRWSARAAIHDRSSVPAGRCCAPK